MLAAITYAAINYTVMFVLAGAILLSLAGVFLAERGRVRR